MLVALLVWLAATIAAFIYLKWWQALLASLATFIVMLYGMRWLALSTLKGMARMAGDLMEVKSRVLRGATIDLHSIKPVPPPPGELEGAAASPDPEDDRTPDDVAEDTQWVMNQNWYEIELTLFPDAKAAGLMEHWDLFDLRLVPRDAKAISLFSFESPGSDDTEEEEVFLSEVEVIVNGLARDPEDGKFVGPQRLRFVAGFPKHLQEVKFRYYMEQFGLIRLPKAMPSPTAIQ